MSSTARPAGPDTARSQEIASNPDQQPRNVNDSSSVGDGNPTPPQTEQAREEARAARDGLQLRHDPRRDIAANWREHRDDPVEPGEGEDDQDQGGQGDEPPARQEPQRREPPAQGYSLKVMGDTIIARDRAELLRHAELDEEEAEGIPEPRLIALAQKTLAANRFLDDAKNVSKDARRQARAGDTPPEQDSGHEDGSHEEPVPPANQGLTGKDVAKAVLYGDEDEAGAAIESAIEQGVTKRLTTIQHQNTLRETASAIDGEAKAFEGANPDIFTHEDKDVQARRVREFYETDVLSQIREEFVSAGLDRGAVEKTLGNIDTALKAVIEARVSGKVKLRDTDAILADAAAGYRKAYGMATPARQEPSAPRTPVFPDRHAQKRGMMHQPSRTSVAPDPTRAPGQSDDNRSSAVERMRKARGQSVG